MTTMMLPLLVFGLYLAWYYWNRANNIKKAGGAQAHAHQLYRKQFGLGPDEIIDQYFSGLVYLGPLRPDVGPSTAEKVISAVGGISHRGANLAFAITNHDRLALAVEQGEQTKLADKAKILSGEYLGMDPYRLFGNSPKPVIRRGEEVFGGHPKYPTGRDIPERVGMSGKVEPCVLLHIEAPGQRAETVWIDPLGAKALCAWSALSAQAVAV